MWRWCRTPFAHCAKRTPTFALRCSRGPLFKPFFAGLDVDFLEADYAGRHKGVLGLLRLAGEARRRGIDAVADMHGVLRSRIVGLLLRLHGMPAARIDKGRIEKWFRLGCTNPAASPLKHTVVRYCDVLRRLGFVFDDPQPAAKPVRRIRSGRKKECGSASHPFRRRRAKTYPEDLAAGLVARTERPLRPRLHPQRRRRRSGLRRTYGARTIPMSRRFGGASVLPESWI